MNNMNLPEKNLQQREVILLDLVKQRNFDPIIWKEIRDGNISIYVGNDALKIDLIE